jgi:hypothetical protein
MAFGLFHERLDEGSEETGDVRFPDQEIQGELYSVTLDVRHAFGAAPEVGLARQRFAQRRDGGPTRTWHDHVSGALELLHL